MIAACCTMRTILVADWLSSLIPSGFVVSRRADRDRDLCLGDSLRLFWLGGFVADCALSGLPGGFVILLCCADAWSFFMGSTSLIKSSVAFWKLVPAFILTVISVRAE